MRGPPIACALAMLAGACSSSAPAVPDGNSTDTRCLIPGNYGALGSKPGTASNTGGNPNLTIVLDAGPPKDDFFLQLVDGNGVFAGGGLSTGTFMIRGVDTSFTACGLCTNIIADIVTGQGPTKFYFTDAGMVTLTSTNPIAGSAQDLHFVEIDINSGMPAPGGCVTTIASLSFGS